MVRILECKEFLNFHSLRIASIPLHVHNYDLHTVLGLARSTVQDLCLALRFREFYMQLRKYPFDNYTEWTKFGWFEELKDVEDDLDVLERMAQLYCIDEFAWSLDCFASSPSAVLGQLNLFQNLSVLYVELNCESVKDLPAINMPKLTSLDVRNKGTCSHTDHDCVVIHLLKCATNVKCIFITNTIFHSKESLDLLRRPLNCSYLSDCTIPLDLIDCGINFNSLTNEYITQGRCAELTDTFNIMRRQLLSVNWYESVDFHLRRLDADTKQETCSIVPVLELIKFLMRSRTLALHGHCKHKRKCRRVINKFLFSLNRGSIEAMDLLGHFGNNECNFFRI